MAENRKGRLDYLENLSKYKAPEGAPDVQGWKVVDKNDEAIGTVAHLLGDTDQHQLRYLDVKLDKNVIDNSDEAYEPNFGSRDRENKDANILVPVGMAHVDKDKQRVVADRLDRNVFNKLPRHQSSNTIGLEDESHIRSMFDEEGGVQLTGERKFNNKKEISDQIASPAEDTKSATEERNLKTTGSNPDSPGYGGQSAGSQSRSEQAASPTGPNEGKGADESSMGTSAQNFYNHQSFDLERFYGKK